ncbi:HMG1/2-like protein [Psilocybe cubensis]|uniref:HMG box domain-containing protein n=2 Tax=Psilocybe cubensis TaxID=181762 RepID=A0A8H7Y0R4_PSICU|nr:HMG1/2-like protein [Psilocybe cubensis]KAH9482531.1 HMG1/2-like protein [Psilocybe cubensis]
MSSPLFRPNPSSPAPAMTVAMHDDPHNDDALALHDQMLFGPIDLDDASPVQHHPHNFHWDSYLNIEPDIKPSFVFPTMANYEFAHPQPPFYDPAALYSPSDDPASAPSLDDLATWINDPDLALHSPSSPIPIPSPSDTNISASSSFIAYQDFPQDAAFSPTAFAALHPLPRSISPPSSFDDPRAVRPRVHSVVSPRDMSMHTPSWASQLWEAPSAHRTQNLVTRPSIRHSPLTDVTLRQRLPQRRGSLSSGQLFQSSSAPSHTESLVPAMTRTYTRRADSLSVTDDRDATVRRKKRSPDEDIQIPTSSTKSADSPLKSVLRPPKLAPSAWQLYFTDWIQKQQASGTRKLNVAQAAKEAGQEYACLSPAEKEPYKRRSQAMKEAREKEHEAYMRTLTPEDIKRENLFRAAQRKAGKSRKSNIKDPNAPKKPLSAYFMFLQRIRASPRLVSDIFGDETETTKQSVLAAAKWRSMTDAERQPFLAQAEQEKMEYEAARRLYEEGTTGFGSSINFSILPGSPHFPVVKMESESESEGFTTDDGSERPIRS